MGSSGGKGGGRSKTTVGYRYFMAGIFGVCLSATKLLKIVYGERVAWSGSVTDGASFKVSAYNLYGGDEVGGSGGLEGNFVFQTGKPGQQANAVMKKLLGNDCPAHRGVVTVTMDKSYVAAFSPSFRTTYFLIQNLGYGWYTDKETIAGTQINPAHEIRDALINPDLSGQFLAEELDEASFKAAADTLYAEKFGLSPKWDQSQKAQEYIKDLLNHIDGILVRDRSTGLIKLKLNRGGYNAASLPVVNESMFSEVKSLGTVTAANMVNKLTIKYSRITDVGEETATLTGENLANIAMQGGVVNSSETEYKHLTDAIPDLPGRILARDLRAQSYPLRSFTLVGTSALASFEEGDLFVFSAPSLGIERLVCRILEIDYGTLDDHRVTLTVSEDIYSVETTAIITPQKSEWSDPFSRPTVPAVCRIMEMPLALAVRYSPISSLQQWTEEYPYAGFVFSLAKRNLIIDHGYTHQTYDNGEWTDYGTGEFCDSALLQSGASRTDTVFNIPDSSLLGLKKGAFGFIGNELVQISSWGTTTLTVIRGIFDTIPERHQAGERLWVRSEFGGGVCTRQYARGNTAQVALAPFSSVGAATPSTSDRLSCSMQARCFRPYPPGGLSFNGVYLADEISGKLTVSWRHRDRIEQVDSIVSQTAASIGPEDGVTYSLKVYDENGALRKNLTGLTGTSWTWDTETADCGEMQRSMRVELWSVRDGYASWQKWNHAVKRKLGDEVLASVGGESQVYADIGGTERMVLKR